LQTLFSDDFRKEVLFISLEAIKLRIADLELQTFFCENLEKEAINF
jgi:hypothetical protein